MSARWESLIPEALHGAVREALTATYGLAPVECLGPVTGGASGAIALRPRRWRAAALAAGRSAAQPFAQPAPVRLPDRGPPRQVLRRSCIMSMPRAASR